MPFEMTASAPQRIAVIGGGISGMAAAHLLATDHAVVLFEGEKRLGGHARTVIAGKRGDQPVDTGFIVFNKVNYPNLVGLFDRLEVPVTESDMGFGASFGDGALEYALRSVGAVFAQKRNLLNPAYLRMLRDILHFNKNALATAKGHDMTIGALLQALGTGPMFRDCYIAPISGAIWSTPVQNILDFPAQAMLDFFKNHALMQVTGQHQWYTVVGGSVEYVRRLQIHLEREGVDIRLGARVLGVKRLASGVMLRVEGGEWELFDEVVFATHSDQTLAMLEDPSEAERAGLGAVRYQPNEAVLHADPSVMPKRKKAWASWVYVEPAGPKPDRIDLTYWMNSLQPIPKDDPLFVTLNSNKPIRDDLIHDVVTFHHPVYDLAAARGRDVIRQINGQRGTWFCGAWMRSGFHEDGFASAVDVVDAMKARNAARQQVAAE
jgi:uncharacterized protein